MLCDNPHMLCENPHMLCENPHMLCENPQPEGNVAISMFNKNLTTIVIVSSPYSVSVALTDFVF